MRVTGQEGVVEITLDVDLSELNTTGMTPEQYTELVSGIEERLNGTAKIAAAAISGILHTGAPVMLLLDYLNIALGAKVTTVALAVLDRMEEGERPIEIIKYIDGEADKLTE